MPYTLRDFGSYTAGGRLAHVTDGTPYEVNFTRSARFTVDPRGHFAIEHAYVQYFIPEARNGEPPVVLVHGGGMSGSCWETTPDERPGWLHGLLDLGYEVHVIDAVERGRAGFAPGHWDGDPLLRSLEEAWFLFRIGPKDGFATRTPFDGQRFPHTYFETFARCFVPRWLSTTALQVNALLAVLSRTGPATVICHSQGGEIVFDALAQDPRCFSRVIALEPSCTPKTDAEIQSKKLCVVMGDFLDRDPFWAVRKATWQSLGQFPTATILGPAELGPGHSHMIMSDKRSRETLNIVMEA